MAKLVRVVSSDMIIEETRKNGASPSSSTSTRSVPPWAPKDVVGKCIDVLDELDGRLFVNERSKPIYTYPIETIRKSSKTLESSTTL